MKRTYNEFIDNGLFVVSHHLKKDIQDITIDDLKETTDYFADLAIKVLDNETLRNIAYTGYFSSAYDFSYRKMKKIFKTFDLRKNNVLEKYNNILNNISNDKYCIYCGEKQTNINFKIGRDYIPDIVAGKFYNSANNLQTVDICPVCCYLSLLSIFNVIPIMNKKNKVISCVLYISDSNEIMQSITSKNMRFIITQGLMNNINNELYRRQSLVKITKEYNFIDYDLENISFITQIKFKNEQPGTEIEKDTINNKKMYFIRKLIYMDDMESFIKFNLYHSLLDDESMIISLINQEHKYIDEGDVENMCDLVEEYEIPSKMKNIIDKTFSMLIATNNEIKLRKEIKLCGNVIKFEKFLMNNYEKSTIDVTEGEIFELTNHKYWHKYKYLLEWKLIREIKKNKGGNENE